MSKLAEKRLKTVLEFTLLANKFVLEESILYYFQLDILSNLKGLHLTKFDFSDRKVL